MTTVTNPKYAVRSDKLTNLLFFHNESDRENKKEKDKEKETEEKGDIYILTLCTTKREKERELKIDSILTKIPPP